MKPSSNPLYKKYMTALARRATIPFLMLLAAAEAPKTQGPKPRHRPQKYSRDLVEALLLLKVQLGTSFRATLAIARVFLARQGTVAALPCDSLLVKRHLAYGQPFGDWTDRERDCRPGETEEERSQQPLRDRLPFDPDQIWVAENIDDLLAAYDEQRRCWLGIDSTGLSVRAPGLWRRDKPGGEKPPRTTSPGKTPSGNPSAKGPSAKPSAKSSAQTAAKRSAGQSSKKPATTTPSTPKGQRQNGIREYAKVHALTDLKSGQVLAAWVSRSGVSDGLGAEYMLRRLQPHLQNRVRAVVADGAYDDRAVYAQMQAIGVTQSLIRPDARASAHPEIPEYALRDPMVTLATRHREIVPGEAAWRDLTGYHVRSLVETTFSVLTHLTGSRLRSRTAAGHLAEIHFRMRLLNGYRHETPPPQADAARAASVQAMLTDTLRPLPTGRRYKVLRPSKRLRPSTKM